MNATPFLSKYQLKTASKFQGRFVPMFQRKNVALFPNKNAKTTKFRIARTYALITIGARSARLDELMNIVVKINILVIRQGLFRYLGYHLCHINTYKMLH